MMRIFQSLFFVSMLAFCSASYALINPISLTLQQQIINAKLWEPGCPSFNTLRLLTLRYYDFSGRVHSDGQIILNQSAADAANSAFEKLFIEKFPIAHMSTLIEEKGDWRTAQQHNLTYGFICYKMADNKFNSESSGTIITLNPVQNPAINLIPETTNKKNILCLLFPASPHCQKTIHYVHYTVFPSAGMLAINRNLKLQGMAEKAAPVFAQFGFEWSGYTIENINWNQFTLDKEENKK